MQFIPSLVTVLALAGGTPASSPAPAASGEEIRYGHGEIELAGTLRLPPGPGPHPALLFVPGSGPHTRAPATPLAERAGALGIASLVYDKRGSGDSSGSWVRASLTDLADDAAVGLRLLREHPRIDPARVGLLAASQGAWVASALSRRSPGIGWMIVISGGGVSPQEAERWAWDKRFEEAGLDAQQRAEAHRVLDAYFGYLGGGGGREALLARLERGREQPWRRVLELERVLPSEANRHFWQWVAEYDPMPAITRMRFPVLVLLGETDRQQPSAVAAERWRQGLEQAGNRDFRIEIFPGIGHSLRAGDPHQDPHGDSLPWADGVLELLDRWLVDHAR